MRPTLATVVLGAFLIPGSMALAADVENGRVLAEENCARCHDIGPGGAAKMHPPAFAAIAAFRPEDYILSRIMFPNLHSQMPSWVNWIDRDGIDDLVAYIVSLEGS